MCPQLLLDSQRENMFNFFPGKKLLQSIHKKEKSSKFTLRDEHNLEIKIERKLFLKKGKLQILTLHMSANSIAASVFLLSNQVSSLSETDFNTPWASPSWVSSPASVFLYHSVSSLILAIITLSLYTQCQSSLHLSCYIYILYGDFQRPCFCSSCLCYMYSLHGLFFQSCIALYVMLANIFFLVP